MAEFDFDIAVVGAGTAGLTAARHAAAGGARVLVLDRMGVGGQVTTVEGITNFPGRPEPVAGYDLGVDLLEEAEAAGAEIMLAEVAGVEPDDDGYVLSAADERIRVRAVIVATGSTRRALDVPGEEEFDGRGVSHCASCDGPFYRGKRVVVVGGGDSAFDEAAILAGFADEVLVVHHGPEPSARAEIVARALEHDNIRTRADASVSAVLGAEKVSAVRVSDLAAGSETEHSADGVFVYVGLTPNTDWLGDLVTRAADGRLVVDDALETSRPGIFAAGDLRSGSAAMLDEAVADGAIAARSALRVTA